MNRSEPRVLLVDDSATIRYAMQNRLQSLGCQVQTVADGAAALAAIRAQPQALVLLDCFLPDLPGHEVARQVRALEQQDPQRPYTPLIGISAEADAAHVRLCLDGGMDGMLDKPVQTADLRKMLSLWCDHECGEEGAAAPPREQYAHDLARLFLSTSQHDLAALQQAHQSGDLATMGKLAHRMKGAALTMQRGEIVALLECLEEAMQDDDDAKDAIVLLLTSLEKVLAANAAPG